jgi:hypothetical protein
MEDYLYRCLHEVIRWVMPHDEKRQKLNYYKARLLQHHSARINSILLDTADADVVHGEDMSTYQLIKIHKRSEQRTVRSVRDAHGTTHSDPAGICEVFLQQVGGIYSQKPVCEDSLRAMKNAIAAQEPYQTRLSFDGPVTSEVRAALVNGRKHKAPGTDGLSLDFYRTHYNVIGEDLCEMLRHRSLRTSSRRP